MAVKMNLISAAVTPVRSFGLLHAEVVPLAKLFDHVPNRHPMVDADARVEEIRGRSAHVAWRYRT